MKKDKAVCKICGLPSEKLFNLKVLNKYNVSYFRCANCGFIQTEKPYWLKDAYSSAIIDSDTGILKRNEILSKITALICLFRGATNAKVLDYGGGYGLLVRMLRDIGLDSYWNDRYAESIFARGFEDNGRSRYDMVTAFELFEHIENPVDELNKIISSYKPKIILISTTIHNGNPEKSWWYFVPEGGQHISLYTKRSLKLLADKVGMKFSTNGVNLHIISRNKIPDILLMAISGFWPVLSQFLKFFYKSKTMTDRNVVISTK